MLACWKESYDKSRQHIKKQRPHFADKGLYSQSYGFSSGHVRIWELDCEENWVPKNWCFWTVVSVVPFSSCLQSFTGSWSFQMSQLFASGGQSIGVSASTSVLPMNTQDWSPLEWTGWISLQSKGSQKSSPTPQFKSINSLVPSFLYGPTLTSIHDYWKKHSFD